MQRNRLTCALLSVLTFLPCAAAQHLGVVEISQDGPLSSEGFVGLTLYRRAVGGVQLCNAPVICEVEIEEATCLSGRIPFSSLGGAEDLASALASALSASCREGLSVHAAGSLLFVSSSQPDIECCVYSSEVGFSDGLARGLNLGRGPAGNCRVQNVGDGTFGNESASAAGGFSFKKSEIRPFAFKIGPEVWAQLFLRRSGGELRATVEARGRLFCADEPIRIIGPTSGDFGCGRLTIQIERTRGTLFWRVGEITGTLCPL